MMVSALFSLAALARLELRQGFERRCARVLVALDFHRVTLPLWNRHGHDFLRESAAGLRCRYGSGSRARRGHRRRRAPRSSADGQRFSVDDQQPDAAHRGQLLLG